MAPRGDSAPSAGATSCRSGGAGAGRGSRCGCGRGSRPGSSRLRGPSAAGTARTAAARRQGARAVAPGGRGGRKGGAVTRRGGAPATSGRRLREEEEEEGPGRAGMCPRRLAAVTGLRGLGLCIRGPGGRHGEAITASVLAGSALSAPGCPCPGPHDSSPSQPSRPSVLVVASFLAAPGKQSPMCASNEAVFKRMKGFRNLRDPVKGRGMEPTRVPWRGRSIAQWGGDSPCGLPVNKAWLQGSVSGWGGFRS